jgi:hypothetical protein
MRFARPHVLAISLVLLAALAGCAHVQRRVLATPERTSLLDPASPYLKAHLKSGSIYVLERWTVRAEERIVEGQGSLFDANRNVLGEGTFRVPFDSVALFETNRVQTSPSIAPLVVMTAISAVITTVCIASPKTCFGSCPTFYVTDGSRPILQAEGFSASVAPALEATDIDALFRARPFGRELEVTMRNEALETHVVRHVDVLAAPRPAGGRVIATQEGTFWEARSLAPPDRAVAAEGDCRAALAAFDGVERWSAADSQDLATRETIDLEFHDPPGGSLGLVLAARQSLLSTYVFYQTLAYLGRSAVERLASLERGGGGAVARAGAVGRVLGGIEVWIEDGSRGWVHAGDIRETGPLAADVKVVPLPRVAGRDLRVRLRLTRGNWRIDAVALTALGKRVEPVRVHPYAVRRGDKEDPQALASLLDSRKALTTLPGDEVRLEYRLPSEGSRCELFLESRGYYLEWMREEWLAEENPILAARMFIDPAGMLRVLAADYKRVEPNMERLFWASRFASP